MTPAILLIIGAATIGPIQAQPMRDGVILDIDHLPGGYAVTPPENDPVFDARVSNCKAVKLLDTFQCRDYVNAGKDGVTFETLPQLCERAMKEIGAHVERWMDVVDGNLQRVNSGWRLNGQTVTCIPVPTGYRK